LTYLTLSYNTVSMEPERRYTLAELAEASASALDALGIASRNGQVRDRPDARTIRYYTALGLVARPAEMTGRTALYGDQHLLQVLAVKAMQAHGASLADVQRTLVGASADELRHAIGPGLPEALAAAARADRAATGRAFWRTPPAAATPAITSPPAAAPLAAFPPGVAPRAARSRPARLASARPAPIPPGPARRLVAVPLAEGATLLIEGADAGALDPGAIDAGALHVAAAPLLAHLTAAGLLPASPT
jgi:DNA-binding transcriptional MerR regulator